MKARACFVIGFAVVMGLFTLVVVAQGPEDSDPEKLVGTPTVVPEPTHVPYDPFRRPETLPEYPGEPRLPGPPPPRAPIAKPTGIDLDVTYISRAPLYVCYRVLYTPDGKPYLQPGTEGDQRWPAYGEVVTFTAHMINKGTAASGSFDFKWLLDDTEILSGTHSSLDPGEEGMETVQWEWAHTVDNERLVGQHTLQFVVDPEDAIAETYESNNSLQDRTDALSLTLAVTPELYAALEIPVDEQWPFSAEDWLQKQIAAMNAAFVRSVYAAAPDGIEERVRLDQILVTSSAPPIDWSEDGGFFMRVDDRYGNAYYDPATDVSGALIHELTHQLGIIDMYNLDVALEVPQVLDLSGRPVQMEYEATALLPGLMGNPGTHPPFYEEHTSLALNANKGYRRGYFGEYLYDIPSETYLRVLDNEGAPAPSVIINLYQRAYSPNMLGSTQGVIDNVAEISVVSDGTGRALLPNRPAGDPVSTHTGHSLTDNPFGLINIVGDNDEFLVQLSKGTHQEYLWLDITRFNLTEWREETTIDIPSHLAPDGAPDPPDALTGTLGYGQVALGWQPSPSMDVAAYHVFHTTGPAYTYTQVLSDITGLSYTGPYDYDARAAGYTVAALDDLGRESGFKDMFWAFRLIDPLSVAVDDDNQRIVLNPHNGYALVYQSPDGIYLDTLGSVHFHLEYSRYLARDASGRLILSHPGDEYSARHSVRVTDRDANLLFEFGERGSDPGEFETPAGVAVWGEPCAYGGPYAPDADTLLLLHLDGSYDGAQGETGNPSGTSFEEGRHDQGVWVDDGDTLTYATADNLQREQGAIEFWVSPQWDGDDGQGHVFFEAGDGWYNRLRIQKDGGNYLRFMLWDSGAEYGVGYHIGHWRAGEWHHVAVTWQGSDIALYTDGGLRQANHTANLPDELADTMYIGSSAWHSEQADAVIDEFRISDVPRVGNSDTCFSRFLVADSGNHRIQAFDELGNFVSAYGGHGGGPGEFDNPQGLAVEPSGNVVVADSGNDRLQVLGFDGTDWSFVRSIAAGFNGPTGVATSGSNRIVVADTGNNVVKVLDAEGELLAEHEAPNDGHTGLFDQPRGVVVDRHKRIVVADTGNDRVVTILDALPIVVTSAADNGPGTLRQALADAEPWDTVLFDPALFPPASPVTIALDSGLPTIVADHLTLDGSAAGVILDGSGAGASTNGLTVLGASGVTIRGLQITNFAGHGIELRDGASQNTVGEDNVIAMNGGDGVRVQGSVSLGNTIFHNSIHDNDGLGISLVDGGNAGLAAPEIAGFDLAAGVVTGTACAHCMVEVFSDAAGEGETYEGQVVADSGGDFILNKGASLSGPYLTATATDADGNTSAFSGPVVYTASAWVAPGNPMPVSFEPTRLVLDCSAGPGGTVTVTLHHQDCLGLPGSSSTAPGCWEIVSDFNGPFTCDLVFGYDESHLHGAEEGDLAGAARWDDGNARWDYLGGTVNTGDNTVTVSDVTAFSPWALITLAPPAAVSDLAGMRSGSDLQLAWSAVTQDILGNAVMPDHYVVYRHADEPYFQPEAGDIIATPGSPSFTDPGVLGDPAHNYYYVVTAVDAAGWESALSNRLGAFDFGLTPAAQADERTYNLVALNLEVPGLSGADSLASYAGGGVYMTIRHDAPLQGIEWRLPELAGTNFAVKVGGAYLLYLDETAPGILSLIGEVPSKEHVRFALTRPAPGGSCAYNFISVPLHRDDLVNADVLAADIGGVYMVSRYNAETQDLTWRMPGGAGENFAVRGGYPYIICLDESAPPEWP